MAAWPDRLEHFLDHYPHIIAAVEAISTFAAVVVALCLAGRSETVRLRALLSIHLSTTDPSQIVILRIHNMGVRAGALAPPPFFEWRIPFLRKRQPETMLSSVNAGYSINRDKVINEITVGSPMKIEVADIETFRTRFTSHLPFIEQKLRHFPQTRLKRLGAVIYTNDDRRFRVTFAKAMAGEIRSLVDDYLRKKSHDTRR
jgi:hypothetical protein